jgi:phosphoribosylformylglycinamidine cyclo-ligase
MASSGLHTNGYSLARKVFFERMKLKPKSYVPELKNTIGEELLKVHVSYGPLVQALLRRFNKSPIANRQSPIVKAFAHITGGGFVDNIPRVLPDNCDAVIRKGTWDVPPVFRLLQSRSRVPEAELYQVFNMGIGMVTVVTARAAGSVVKFIRSHGHRAWIIGEVRRGTGKTRVV